MDLPDVLAERGETRLLDPGSPVRYYSPAVPPTFVATAVTLRRLWQGDADRKVVVTAAAGPAVALGLTNYLVPAVNRKLMAAQPPGHEQRRRLVATWQGVNSLRLAALACGTVALHRAARTLR